jgi:two-component system chemotaxis sensor kinase CheA
MQAPSSAAASELAEVARLAADLAAGNTSASQSLRTGLRRVIAAPEIGGAVKTLAVQALLLVDDPRVGEGRAGRPLLAKIERLVAAAIAAHAAHDGHDATPSPAPAAPNVEFSPNALLLPDADRELVTDFVTESRELLQVAEAALLALDGDPTDTTSLDTLFRAFHTIKGTSAFLGVEHATELAHLAESQLARLRSGALSCTGEISNLIFRSIDMLDGMLNAIDAAADGAPAMLPDGFRTLVAELSAGPSAGARAPGTRHTSGQFRRVLGTDVSVRVRAADLDRLAEMVRELVLTHAMLSRDPALRAAAQQDLGRKIAHAERLAYEIEGVASELRTVAFGATMQKLARLARDLAYQSGKSIELVADGEDVLVERAMAEAIADPLLHMVRNAIDHGIEMPEERLRGGKPEAGQLRITAKRDGSQLVIEVSDDGRGIDMKRIAVAAVERGFISEGTRMSDAAAVEMVFRPGFSTASVVTDLSGRGVGMDVVRTNVEAVGGSVEVDTRVGHGTRFTIRLPFRSQSGRGQQASAPSASWSGTQRTIGLIA